MTTEDFINTGEKQPKEIIYATSNESKVRALQRAVGDGYKIRSLQDLKIDSQVEEDGKDPKENAIKKARACFQMTGKPSFSMDFGFFIEGLPDAEQPGPFVKRMVPISQEREPSDDEVLAYYIDIIKRLGGKANAYWLRALAYVSKDGEFVTEMKIPKMLVDVPSDKRNKGFPMTSIQIDPKFNKYESELTEEELKESHKETDEFVKNFIELHTTTSFF